MDLRQPIKGPIPLGQGKQGPVGRITKEVVEMYEEDQRWPTDHGTYHHRRSTREGMGSKGSVYTPTTTTTGSKLHVQMDGVNSTVHAGRVLEGLSQLHQNMCRTGKESSQTEGMVSYSWNSRSHPVDTQARGTTSTHAPASMVDVGGQPVKVRPDKVPNTYSNLPTFTYTSISQPSRLTPPPGTIDEASWLTDPVDQTRAMEKREGMGRHPGHHGEDDDGWSPRDSGDGLRRWVAEIGADFIMLGVVAMHLYLRHLHSCLDPRSELSARMRSGRVTAVDVVTVPLAVIGTFHFLFGLYQAFVYLRAVFVLVQAFWACSVLGDDFLCDM
ncbi:uncharacterized protein DNG_08543 [Cephalotrichum gorgonifer]|uniref:Uncharacterized protein n=1 Tax=Cephalotrichum gorgonifer TaxID=2041049 RepID=A0AAE8N3R2_9PEZI|nr:uncharacterized protein DNG_08543 [Cephalotrichum gorgonifer]